MKYFISFLALISQFVAYAQTAQQGILDLREWDFEKTLILEGEYEFYWKTLEVEPKKPATGHIVFPTLWNNQIIGQDTLDPRGYATYKLKVLVPKGKKYSMIVQDVYTSFAIYANGELIAENGEVGNSKETSSPEWKPLKTVVPVFEGDTLDLTLQISNFIHSKGGSREDIIFGERSAIDRLFLKYHAYDLILAGSLLMGGLFFLGLYLFGRHEPSILFFSLFCMTYSYRIIGSGFYVLHSLIQDYSWWVAIRIEYISLFGSVLLFAYFIKGLYPEDVSKKFIKAVVILCSVFILCSLILTPFYFSQTVEPFFVILLGLLGYTLWIYAQAWFNRRPGSLYALLSTGVVLFIFGYNILVYFGVLVPNYFISFLGYILFFFSQSLLLSHRFAFSLNKAKETAEAASSAKSDFLSTISHEIRTPLNAIVGLSHLILRSDPRDDQKEKLETLTFSAENLTSLINDILDYNKIESGQLIIEEQPIHLKYHLENIVKGYRAEAFSKGLVIVYRFDKRLNPNVIADPIRLGQVFNNLINNAIKFTSKGHIIVRADLLRSGVDDQTIHFSIKDTGTGIPRDKIAFIFERFTQASSSTTREFGGTGLGLSIVKGILHLYNSHIEVDSIEGKGASFYFDLTLKTSDHVIEIPELKPSFTKPKETPAEFLEGKRILVVEDNLMNMLIAEEFLTSWKIKLSKAENGVEALQKVHEEQFDLILMDLHMPVMDGYQATMEIKKIKPHLPIVALTASTLNDDEDHIFKAGMDGFILKPFHPKDLKSKIIQILQESKTEQHA